MGALRYNGDEIDFDDDTLMQLMIVVTARLRRNEPFLLSWHEDGLGGLARRSVWLHSGADLAWRFAGPDPAVDRPRIEEMMTAAGSSLGLEVRRRSLVAA